MPALRDNRLEKFCLYLVDGLPVKKALDAAGYAATSSRQYGYSLRQRKEVQVRVAELQAGRQKAFTNSCIRDRQHYLSLLYDIGAHGKNEGARVRAIELAGMEECGMFVKRSETVSVSLELPALERMTADSLRSLASKIQERIGQLDAKSQPKQVATTVECTPVASINNATASE